MACAKLPYILGKPVHAATCTHVHENSDSSTAVHGWLDSFAATCTAHPQVSTDAGGTVRVATPALLDLLHGLQNGSFRTGLKVHAGHLSGLVSSQPGVFEEIQIGNSAPMFHIRSTLFIGCPEVKTFW